MDVFITRTNEEAVFLSYFAERAREEQVLKELQSVNRLQSVVLPQMRSTPINPLHEMKVLNGDVL